MVKKLKILAFSITFLTYSAFPGHTTFSVDDPFADFKEDEIRVSVPPLVTYDPEEEEKVREFCNRYGFWEQLTDQVYSLVKGKAFELDNCGVPNLDHTAAFLLYNKRRASGEFGLLFDLFTKTPSMHRKKIWQELVVWRAYKSTGPALEEFKYFADGYIFASPYEVPGTVTLGEKLFALPYEDPK